MAKNDRFENVYSQGGLSTMEIWVDKETGVNYLFHTSGYAGGMTPLLEIGRASCRERVFPLV